MEKRKFTAFGLCAMLAFSLSAYNFNFDNSEEDPKDEPQYAEGTMAVEALVQTNATVQIASKGSCSSWRSA